ncbi:MAG: SdpI family protein [Peptococcaceae bacterium]|nr:SdpI family protein [Peptococcaceae bacterium]
MNPKNKRTLFLTSTICIILSIVAFALSQMSEISTDNYILLYVIAVFLNIVLNLALSISIAATNGAKALVSLGKWIMPIAGVVYLIPQIYSVLFPAKIIQDAYWYVFIGIIFIISGNYFPKNHINPYVGLKFPWLFDDEEGWYKTHRLGAYTWILAGIISILHPLHNLVVVTVPLIIFLVGVVPLVYSLALYFKREQSN